MSSNISDASPEHARELAFLINLAGDGLPEYFWSEMAEEQTPLDVGASRAARSEGNFSYTKARVALDGDKVLGMVLAYSLPDPYDAGDLSDVPAFIKPLLELEARAAGTWYINAIACFEGARGQGIGAKLLEDTERRAAWHRCSRTSLIVSSENPSAMRLYERMGYREDARVAAMAWPGSSLGGEWVLMLKNL